MGILDCSLQLLFQSLTLPYFSGSRTFYTWSISSLKGTPEPPGIQLLSLCPFNIPKENSYISIWWASPSQPTVLTATQSHLKSAKCGERGPLVPELTLHPQLSPGHILVNYREATGIGPQQNFPKRPLSWLGNVKGPLSHPRPVQL